nr:hypothetical protein [Tanacetum cinerariifolium]
MSTQQDIYAVGSESRPPMLNKENYVTWSSRLLWYSKSRPSGNLIHNSILNGPYVRRMKPEPGDVNREVTTILLSLPEDIYAAVDSCETAQPEWSRHVTIVHQTKDLHTADYTQLYDFLKYNQKENYLQQPMPNPKDITDPTTTMNMALALMAKAFKLNYSTPTNNNQRISSNPHNGQIAQPARAEGNATGQNGNQIRCYNYKGVGHYARNCTIRPRRRDDAYLQTHLLIAQKEEAGIQLQAEEYDLMVVAADLDEIKEVNANCILMANLQQASTSGTQIDSPPVYDLDGSAEVHNYENCYDNEIFNTFTQEEQYTELLEPIPESHQVPQNDNDVISEDTSVEQDDTTPSVARKFLNEVKSTIVTLQRVVKHRMTIETHNWSSFANQELHKIVRDEIFPIVNQVDARVQNFKIQFLKEAAKFIGDFKSLANEADASLAKHKALELEIERFLKAVVSQDIMNIVQKESGVDTSDLQTELERTKERFENYIIKKENEYAKLWNDWNKKFTSNSVSTPQEPKIVNNDNVIAPGMFRINLDKTSREEKNAPNAVRASNRTKPITISQPTIFTKKDVNSDLNGLSSTGVDNTKTRRPQPRCNTKHDRVPSVSKNSRSKNKEAEVEEHHRNLLLFKNNKHISSACNNIKIDSQDLISKVICAMCKKCLISVNHDVCLNSYVNGKKSHGKKQMVKVSVKEIQKKYQPKVTKPKKVEILERLATPKPRKPRFLLRWSPTGRLFDQEGKLVASSESESQSNCSNCDNACTSNTLEPKIKRFPNSTSLLD